MTSNDDALVGDTTERYLNTEGMLECTICLRFMDSQIYQCENGHLICNSCYEQLGTNPACGVCRRPFTSNRIRNRALEEVVERGLALNLINLPGTSSAVHGNPARPIARGVRRCHRVETHDVFCSNVDCPRIVNETRQIEGVRYTCASCPNLNFCETCVTAGVHNHHVIIGIPSQYEGTRIESALESAGGTTTSIQPPSVAPIRVDIHQGQNGGMRVTIIDNNQNADDDIDSNRESEGSEMETEEAEESSTENEDDDEQSDDDEDDISDVNSDDSGEYNTSDDDEL